LKTYFKDGDTIRLEPSNPEFKTIRTKKDNISILGKLVGLYRFY
ncbi:MAG TPA: S24 family peptidase, partial [Leptospiraceae bacterium]|nr:S24 family peptidase [Leptospiraceae bacterium]